MHGVRVVPLAVLVVVSLVAGRAVGQVVTVPGTADIVLAWQPDGTSIGGDQTPTHGPPVVELPAVARSLSFAATGSTAIDSSFPLLGPEGGSTYPWYTMGNAFGLSRITALESSLLGVFLGPSAPDPDATPPALDFLSDRNFVDLSPEIQQLFFIGDGMTDFGVRQVFRVPDGATRLFLGTLDCNGCCYNNPGSLEVTVSPAAEPLTVELLAEASTYSTGEESEIRLRVVNATEESAGPFEVKVFVILPNGNRRGLVNEPAVSYAAGSDETFEIARHRWRGHEPAGEYVVELRFLDPVTGDLRLSRRLFVDFLP